MGYDCLNIFLENVFGMDANSLQTVASACE